MDVDAALLLDRFVSASTGEDVQSSLEGILTGLRNGQIKSPKVCSEVEVLQALISVLHTSQYKNLPVEDGSALVARIYLELAKDKSAPIMTEPAPGKLLEALVDVATSSSLASEREAADNREGAAASGTRSASSSHAAYSRVLALQVLRQLCLTHPRQSQSQLLNAPNGLHRLGELLQPALVGGTTPEQVRNEALLLAAVVAEWPSAAKVWMFNEVGDSVIQLAMQEGGLTDGNVLVVDCLRLLQNMLKHDAALADLVFQSPVLAPNLARLLDLRNGTQFLHPPVVATDKAKKKAAADDVDDLDELINRGTAAKTSVQGGRAPPATAAASIPVPRLTAAEEQIVHGVLDIFAVVMENDAVRRHVWKQHAGLAALVWEMALIAPAPPGVPYPCAVPSPDLQQRALQITARYFYDPDLMDRHAGLDRLLYLVCTGGLGADLSEKMALSQSALHVIRRTLTSERAQEMLLYTLAPPMTMQDDDDDKVAPDTMAQHPLTVVQKLLNTVYENLSPPQQQQQQQEGSNSDEATAERRKIFLAGALGGLALFLTDEASRAVMLRLTANTLAGQPSSSEHALIDSILDLLLAAASSDSDDDQFIALTLLRFLCQWLDDAPFVVQAILSSGHSVSLSELYGSKNEKLATFASLLLGLCMPQMSENETQCGGWTRQGIMEMISKRAGGLGRFLSRLEKFKSIPRSELPWSYCTHEWDVWLSWYDDKVLVVRKKMVEALTSSGSEAADEDGSELVPNEQATTSEKNQSSSSSSSRGLKSLQTLVAQQSSELDELRTSIARAEATIASQEKQLAMWKLRVESTPTQLDEILSDFTAKNAELEQKVVLLENENRELQSTTALRTKEKDAQIESLQQTIRDCQDQEREAREETNTLREEMAALSQAYTSLEDEFRRQSQVGGSATMEMPPSGYNEDTRQQPEGEVSEQAPPATGSTEVAALRAENARLRKDARAADEWMQMAVERMQAIGAENISLQREVEILSNDLQQAGLLPSVSQEAHEQLIAERSLRSRLETEVELLKLEGETKLQEEQLLRAELEDALRNHIKNVEDALAKADMERTALAHELEGARFEISNLKGELADSSGRSSENAVTDDVVALQRSLELLQRDFEHTNSKQEEEIYKRESRIRELESRLSEGLGPYTIDDIRIRDEEISQLRLANEAAQDWMSKAVDHHQLLSDQLAQLVRDNNSLQAHVRELNASVLSSELASAANEERDSELERLRAELGSLTAEIAQMQQSERSNQESRLQMEDLSRQLRERDQIILNLQGGNVLDKLREQLDEKSAQLDEMYKELAELTKQLNAKDNQLLDLRTQLELNEVKISSSQADAIMMKELQTEVSQLKFELEAVRGREISQLEEHANNLREQLAEQEHDTAQVVAQWEETYQELQHQLVETQEQVRAAEERVRIMQSHKTDVVQDDSPSSQRMESYRAMEQEKDQLSAELAKSYAEIDILREKLAASIQEHPYNNDERIADLKSQLEALQRQAEEQGRDADDTINEWMQRVQALEKERDELSSQLSMAKAMPVGAETGRTYKERAEDLTLQLSNLQNQLGAQGQDASNTINQWMERHQAVEKEKDELSTMLRESKELIDTLNERLAAQSQKSNEQIDHLLSQVQTLQTQLEQQRQDGQVPETERAELSSVLDSTKAMLSEAVAEVDQSNKERTRTSELTSEIAKIQLQIQQQARDAETIATERDVVLRMLDDCRAEIVDLKEQLAVALMHSESSSEQIGKLLTQIQNLQSQLEDQGRDAEEVSNQWQETFQALEKERDELRNQLEANQARLAEAEAAYNDSLEEIKTFKTNILAATAVKSENSTDDLLSQVQNLQSQLEVQRREADEGINRWVESFQALERERDELTSQLFSAKATLAVAESARMDDEQARNAELTSQVAHLRDQLNHQAQEADSVITQWMESHDALQKEKNQLSMKLDQSFDEIEDLKALLSDTTAVNSENRTERIDELLSQVQILQSKLEEQGRNAEEAINKWMTMLQTVENERDELRSQITSMKTDSAWADSEQAQLAELSSKVADLRIELDLQGQEADSVIRQWMQSHNALQKEKDELAMKLDKSLQENEALQALVSDATALHSANSVQRMEEFSSLQSQLDEQGRKAEHWMAMLQTVEKERDELSSEHYRMKSLLATLESAREGSDKAQNELTSQIADLRAELYLQVEEAENTIKQWAESYNGLLKLKDELSTKLDESLAEIEAFKAGSLDATVVQSENKAERIDELLTQVHHLNSQVDERGQDTDEAAKHRMAMFQAVEKERDELRTQMATMRTDSALVDGEQAQPELSSQVIHLRAQLDQQAQEAENTIKQWAECYGALQKENDELSTKYHQSLEEIEVLKAEAIAVQSENNPERIDELLSQVHSLQSQLDEQGREAEEAISRWMTSLHMVEKERDELSSELYSMKSLLATVESAQDDNERAHNEHTSRVGNLQAQLDQQGQEAVSTIKQWAESYDSLQKENDELSTKLRRSLEEIEVLKAEAIAVQSENNAERIDELLSQVHSLQIQLDEQGRAAEEATDKWVTSLQTIEKERDDLRSELYSSKSQLVTLESAQDDNERAHNELISQVGILQAQLDQQGQEAENTIKQWAESYDSLQKENDELSTKLRQSLEEIEVLKAEATAVQSENNAERIDELLSQVHSLQSQLDEQGREADEATNKWVTSLQTVEKERDDLRSELYSMKSLLVTLESAGEDSKQAHNELISQVGILQAQLDQQGQEAENTIKQWVESYDSLQKENDELSTKLRQSLEEIEVLKAEATAVQSENNAERIDELLSQVHSLQSQLHEQGREAEEATNKWVTSLQTIEKERDDLRSELYSAKSLVLTLESAQEDSKQAHNELVSQVGILQAQLDQQGQEAENTIKQWAESYDSIQKEKDELFTKLDHSSQEIEAFKAELSDAAALHSENNKQINELLSQVEILQNQLDEQGREAEEAINKWMTSLQTVEKERDELSSELYSTKSLLATVESAREDSEHARNELTSQVTHLQAQLDQQDHETENTIKQWAESYDSLQKENDELSTKLRQSLEEIEVLKAEATAVQSENNAERIDELLSQVHGLQSQLDELLSQVHSLQSQLDEQGRAAEEATDKWVTSLQTIEKERDDLRSELYSSKSLVVALESAQEDSKQAHNELTSRVANLQAQLDQQGQEAESTIKQWAESYDSIQKENDELSTKLRQSLEWIEVLKAEATAVQSENNAERIDELLSQVHSLQSQLDEQGREADEATNKWMTSLQTIEKERDDLRSELYSSKSQLVTLESAQEDSKQAHNELTSQVGILQAQLDQQGQEAENTIKQWAESYGALQKENDELSTKLRQSLEWIEVLKAEATAAQSENNAERIDELSSQVQSLHSQLDEQGREAEEAINTWMTSLQTVEKERDELSSELYSMKSLLVTLESAGEDSEQVHELNSQVTHLRAELDHQGQEAENTVKQWAESYDSLQKENDELSTKLRQSLEVIEAWKAERSEATAVQSENNAERIDELLSQVHNLQSKLDEQGREAEEAINKWTATFQALDNERVGLRSQLESTRTLYADAKGAHNELLQEFKTLEARLAAASAVQVEGTEERIDELLSHFRIAQSALEQQGRDADDAIGEWRESFQALQKERDELAAQLESAQALLENAEPANSNKEQVQISELWSQVTNLQVKLDEQVYSYQTILREKDEATTKLTETKERLETSQRELEEAKRELNEAQTKYSVVVSQLHVLPEMEELVSSLRKRESILRKDINQYKSMKESLETENNSLRRKHEDAEDRANRVECKFEEAEAVFSTRLETALSENLRRNGATEAERVLQSEKLRETEQELELLRTQKTLLEQANSALKAHVAELEDDLQQASDTMQLYITNEVAGRATELAVDALRQQLDKLREKLEIDQTAFNHERDARQAAEQELSRVQADLASLLGIQDTIENRSQVQQKVMDMSERFQRSEAAEIEAIRCALSQALDELSVAREGEKQARETAARANFQASLCEQELVSAKSDYVFLTKTIDEMREAESARNASFQYRIVSLENDHHVLKRLHSTEMECLRNELDQVSMERDRLFQSLKESEKSKEALVRSSARGLSSESITDPFVELELLRMEKSQLLSIAADDASRVERRLREARAAEKSSSEADLILERELRLATEKALHNARLELADLQKELDSQDSEKHQNRDSTLTSSLRAEAENLTSEIRSLMDENDSLKQLMAHTKREASIAIEQLTEECRIAKARVMHLEREGRIEAEMRAEIRFLQSPRSIDAKSHTIVEHDDPAEDDAIKENSKLLKLTDEIFKLRRVIDEERTEYEDLLVEHDELLALLAQKEILGDTLQATLVRLGGQETADAAVHEAEEKARSQYGKSVKLV